MVDYNYNFTKLLSSKEIIARHFKKIGKASNITCFGLVDTALPIVDGFLAYADCLSKFLLR